MRWRILEGANGQENACIEASNFSPSPWKHTLNLFHSGLSSVRIKVPRCEAIMFGSLGSERSIFVC